MHRKLCGSKRYCWKKKNFALKFVLLAKNEGKKEIFLWFLTRKWNFGSSRTKTHIFRKWQNLCRHFLCCNEVSEIWRLPQAKCHVLYFVAGGSFWRTHWMWRLRTSVQHLKSCFFFPKKIYQKWRNFENLPSKVFN